MSIHPHSAQCCTLVEGITLLRAITAQTLSCVSDLLVATVFIGSFSIEI